jgi:hypothetical protein
VYLPDAQLKKLADHGSDFLREVTVTPELVAKFAELDLASREDLKAVASVIMDWRPDAQLAIGLTPRGGDRRKQQNTTTNSPQHHSQPIAQPFFSPARLPRGRGRGRRGGTARGGGQIRNAAGIDGDFFAPTSASAVPSRTMSTRSNVPQLPLAPPVLSQPSLAEGTSTTLQAPASMPYGMPYYPPAYMYAANSMYYPQYPMYTLPPRYYPQAPSNPSQNK